MIKTVLPEEFDKLINTWEYEVIDIRTPQELEIFWIIPWMAKHLDVYTQIDEILALPKDKKYLIYCYHGNRTRALLQYMEMNWFKEVIDLAGGTENRVNSWFKLVSYQK